MYVFLYEEYWFNVNEKSGESCACVIENSALFALLFLHFHNSTIYLYMKLLIMTMRLQKFAL